MRRRHRVRRHGEGKETDDGDGKLRNRGEKWRAAVAPDQHAHGEHPAQSDRRDERRAAGLQARGKDVDGERRDDVGEDVGVADEASHLEEENPDGARRLAARAEGEVHELLVARDGRTAEVSGGDDVRRLEHHDCGEPRPRARDEEEGDAEEDAAAAEEGGEGERARAHDAVGEVHGGFSGGGDAAGGLVAVDVRRPRRRAGGIADQGDVHGGSAGGRRRAAVVRGGVREGRRAELLIARRARRHARVNARRRGGASHLHPPRPRLAGGSARAGATPRSDGAEGLNFSDLGEIAKGARCGVVRLFWARAPRANPPMSAHAERHVYRRAALPLAGRFAGRSVRMLRSHPKTDRGSVFVAHLAYPIHTEAEARAAIASLKRDAGHCDHAMSAWRVPAPPKPPALGTRPSAAPRVDSGFDDDGEPRGGASIRAELNARKALGVAAVVTRAYGGVNLGKARFEHIRERVAVLIQAAGVQPGVMATDDAFRGVGRTLGGVRALAAALGGGVLLESGEEAAEKDREGSAKRTNQRRTNQRRTDQRRTDQRRTDQKQRPKPIPNDVAEDIRRRLAEAAERRAAAENAASSIASVASVASADAVANTNAPASPTVIHLLDDDDDAPFPRAKRSKVE